MATQKYQISGTKGEEIRDELVSSGTKEKKKIRDKSFNFKEGGGGGGNDTTYDIL